MALESQHVSEVQIALADENVLWGACEINDDFGEVQTASLRRESDQKEFMKCNGDLLALVLSKFKTVLTLEVLIKEGAALPGIADRIGFPGLNAQGRILTVEKKWSQDGGQMLSINATQWDVFQSRELATKVVDGQVEFIGPNAGLIDFEGFTFTNEAGGTLAGEASYAGRGITVVNTVSLGLSDEPFHPLPSLIRLTNFTNAVLLFNDNGFYAAYDIATSRLHFWDVGTMETAALRDTGVEYLGYIIWKRSI